MKVGLFLPQMGENITVENVLYIATEAEREGLGREGLQGSSCIRKGLDQ